MNPVSPPSPSVCLSTSSLLVALPLAGPDVFPAWCDHQVPTQGHLPSFFLPEAPSLCPLQTHCSVDLLTPGAQSLLLAPLQQTEAWPRSSSTLSERAPSLSSPLLSKSSSLSCPGKVLRMARTRSTLHSAGSLISPSISCCLFYSLLLAEKKAALLFTSVLRNYLGITPLTLFLPLSALPHLLPSRPPPSSLTSQSPVSLVT